MHGTNSKLVRSLAANIGESRPAATAAAASSDLGRNNFILLRGAKSPDGGHILLRTDNLTHSKNNLLLEDTNGKIGQILIQQSEIKKGVFVQSVKRLSSGTPIFLLSGGDNGNGHILIQAAPPEDARQGGEVEESTGDNILVQALEGIQDGEAGSSRGISTPIGSGKGDHYSYYLLKYSLFNGVTLNYLFSARDVLVAIKCHQ